MGKVSQENSKDLLGIKKPVDAWRVKDVLKVGWKVIEINLTYFTFSQMTGPELGLLCLSQFSKGIQELFKKDPTKNAQHFGRK